jgi:hypothetical protein
MFANKIIYIITLIWQMKIIVSWQYFFLKIIVTTSNKINYYYYSKTKHSKQMNEQEGAE